MKRRIYFAAAITILAGVLTISANAQSTSSQQLTVHIPFSFTTGRTTLPSGDYRISVLNPKSSIWVLEIKAESGESVATALTNNIRNKKQDVGTVVFHKYGDQYFFAEAWMAMREAGLATVNSKAERSLQRELARVGKKAELVALNGR